MKYWSQIVILAFLSYSMQSCSILSAAGLSSQGQPIKKVFEKIDPTSQSVVDHSQWVVLLKKHVNSEGLVDYQGFLKDQKELEAYLKMLAANPPSESWTTAELLAYYINTYNAYTVELILQNYPIKSIKDIPGAWTKGRVPIGDKTLSLGGIENSILRKMNEPRIHFAINCASLSCPNLLNEAYVPEKIATQLDEVTRKFINSSKNSLSKKEVKLSHIFKWYRKDFQVQGEKDLIGFINQYTQTKIAPNASIDFLEYDWSLNEQQ